MPDDALISFLYALITNRVALFLMCILALIVLRNILALDDEDFR
jgi:hypothetical protein